MTTKYGGDSAVLLTVELDMDWNTDLSKEAQETMKFLGDFGPTVRPEEKELKGYMHDDEGGGKVYLCADELRQMAANFIEVADWLDKRAAEMPNAELWGERNAQR